MVQSRSVFACIESSIDFFLTFCCDSHGYGLVAFDSSPAQNQTARRFTYEGGSISEAIPCCVLRENTEKIKTTLLNDKMNSAELGDANAQSSLGACY